MEEEDIGRFFDEAAAFIEAARDCGGAALVHCHEGKSRSVTLVLAYFMQAKASLRASFSFDALSMPLMDGSCHLDSLDPHVTQLCMSVCVSNIVCILKPRSYLLV